MIAATARRPNATTAMSMWRTARTEASSSLGAESAGSSSAIYTHTFIAQAQNGQLKLTASGVLNATCRSFTSSLLKTDIVPKMRPKLLSSDWNCAHEREAPSFGPTRIRTHSQTCKAKAQRTFALPRLDCAPYNDMDGTAQRASFSESSGLPEEALVTVHAESKGH